MRAMQHLVFGLGFSLLSGSVFAKPLPSKYGQMQNGHVTPQCLEEIKRDSEQARSTLEPARYQQIVQDPYNNASTDQERIAALAAREIIYLVDRSGSMTGGDKDPTGAKRPQWTLWKSALEAGKSLFEVALSLDSNGKLDVVLWDHDGKQPRFVHKEISQLSQMEELFNNNQPYGYTPLAEALSYIYNKKLRAMLEKEKPEPFTVIVLTDGVPGNGSETPIAAQEKVYAFFKDIVAKHHLTSPGRETLAAFSFVQAGDDKGAEAFLTRLDDELKQGYVDSRGLHQPGLGIDIIDYKKDNFIFGTDEYRNVEGVGPMGIFWGAMFD